MSLFYLSSGARLGYSDSGAGLPVVHTVALLDWMAGGPEPAGLPARD